MSAEQTTGVTAIVGVSAGLGAALARRFASAYSVALSAREKQALEDLDFGLRGSDPPQATAELGSLRALKRNRRFAHYVEYFHSTQ
jgi:NADP-dependent 3-hydroxy acid dehydrogenase YdfG